MRVLSIYDPEGDFIEATEVPELEGITHQLDDTKSTDVYAGLLADRQKAVDQIDASTSELEELAKEHDADILVTGFITGEVDVLQGTQTDYGDPVTDQGGKE